MSMIDVLLEHVKLGWKFLILLAGVLFGIRAGYDRGVSDASSSAGDREHDTGK